MPLIDQGMTNKDIARHLGIGVATAKSHVHHILEKLQVRGRSQAAARLRQSG
jgi:DNA-binding NarL/FixJ family response regulator